MHSEKAAVPPMKEARDSSFFYAEILCETIEICMIETKKGIVNFVVKIHFIVKECV